MTKKIQSDTIVEDNWYPDTKIPRVIFPEYPEGLTHKKWGYKLSVAIVLLNLNTFNSDKHYAAMIPIETLNSYVLFYRKPFGSWEHDNMIVLKKNKTASLSMLDTNKRILSKLQNIIGIKPPSKHLRNKIKKTIKRGKKQKNRKTMRRKRTPPKSNV